MYSLAALGWYCLTGRAPEPGAQRPPLPLLVQGVPAELAAALESGLHEDRRLRPSAAELAAAVHRSAVAEPVDLSVSVHPTVIPQLLTRRSLPATARERQAERLRALLRRFHKPRAAWPLPLGGSHGTGRPARSASARHSARSAAASDVARSGAARSGASHSGAARRDPWGRGGFRTAAVGLACLVVLVAAWGIAGAPLPPAFPDFAMKDAEAAKEHAQTLPAPVPEPAPPATDATAVPPVVQAQLASPDPEEAVRGLAWLRSVAFSTGDFRLLDQVNVPASSAAVADGRISASLKASGRVLAGFTSLLTQVAAAEDRVRHRAVVAVAVSTSAYQERDAGGVVVAQAAAAPEQRLRLVLAPVEGRWRIQDVLPADAG